MKAYIVQNGTNEPDSREFSATPQRSTSDQTTPPPTPAHPPSRRAERDALPTAPRRRGTAGWLSKRYAQVRNRLLTPAVFDGHHGPSRRRGGLDQQRNRAALRGSREGPTSRAAVDLVGNWSGVLPIWRCC